MGRQPRDGDSVGGYWGLPAGQGGAGPSKGPKRVEHPSSVSYEGGNERMRKGTLDTILVVGTL